MQELFISFHKLAWVRPIAQCQCIIVSKKSNKFKSLGFELFINNVSKFKTFFAKMAWLDTENGPDWEGPI